MDSSTDSLSPIRGRSHHRPRPSPIVFLGGPLSAALLGVCLPPFETRILPWFALLPFLLSLHRQRDRPLGRLAHAAGLALGVAIISLPGVAGALTGSDQGTGAGWSALRTIPVPILGLSAFALAAGPILRGRGALCPLVGLPVLWAGLEVLLGAAAPAALGVAGGLGAGASPFDAGGEGTMFPGGGTGLLGHAVPPGLPEARIATAIGVHGLGLLIVLAATCFLMVLREARALRQVGFAACGALIPLAAAVVGRELPHDEPAPPDLTVVVAAQAGGRVEDLARLTREPASLGASLIVWPQAAIGVAAEEGRVPGRIAPEVRDLVGTAGALLLSGLALEGRDGAIARTDLVAIDPSAKPVWWVDSRGEVRGDRADPRDPRLILAPCGRLAPTGGGGALATRRARDLVRAGADILLVSSPVGDAGHGDLVASARILRSDRFVAIQTGRWLVRSGPRGAYVASPRGDVILQVKGGLEGAGMTEVAIEAGVTPYVLRGWWVEVACAIGAIALLGAALARGCAGFRACGKPSPHQ